MPMSGYDKQLIAIQAAATINGDGTTPIAYGCSITRFGTGVYKLILPTGEALVDAQTFSTITCKGDGTGTPGADAFAMASDETDFIKTAVVRNNAGVLVNTGVEMIIQRSTINPF